MSSISTRTHVPCRSIGLLGAAALSLVLLGACDGQMGLGNDAGTSDTASQSTKLVERDVEAPEVFSVTEEGLWDGRPSLGGVWVAHPDVTDPERVIVRNEANGKFVIGALFRRERDLPGPKLQISSDAAAALDILAGAPAPLNVTALRREEAQGLPADTDATEAASPGAIAAPADVTETTLDPVAPGSPAPMTAPAAAPIPVDPAPAAASTLARPYVQLGIFSVEANAERLAKQMRGAGMTPSVKRSEINDKPFWRVLVGPAQTTGELNTMIDAVKAEGYTDAYAVAN